MLFSRRGLVLGASSLIALQAAKADQSFLYNFTGSNLPNWTAALLAVTNQTRNASIGAVGDSLTAGVGSGTGNGWPGARANSWPMQLASILTQIFGVPASSAAFFGNGRCLSGATPSQYDPRIGEGAGWGSYLGAGSRSIGGEFYTSQGATTSLGFVPGVPADTFETITLPNSQITASIDGTTTVLPNTGSGTPVRHVLAAGSFGTHSISFTGPSGVSSYVLGGRSFNSAQKCVLIDNYGAGGTITADWIDQSQPWTAFNALQVMTPDLVPILLGTNDMFTGVPLATSIANITTLSNAAAAWGGDSILFVPPPQISSLVPLITQQNFATAMYALAKKLNRPLIDLSQLFNTYVTGNAAGFYFPGDGQHFNTIGYNLIAELIARAIMCP